MSVDRTINASIEPCNQSRSFGSFDWIQNTKIDINKISIYLFVIVFNKDRDTTAEIQSKKEKKMQCWGKIKSLTLLPVLKLMQ